MSVVKRHRCLYSFTGGDWVVDEFLGLFQFLPYPFVVSAKRYPPSHYLSKNLATSEGS